MAKISSGYPKKTVGDPRPDALERHRFGDLAPVRQRTETETV